MTLSAVPQHVRRHSNKDELSFKGTSGVAVVRENFEQEGLRHDWPEFPTETIRPYAGLLLHLEGYACSLCNRVYKDPKCLKVHLKGHNEHRDPLSLARNSHPVTPYQKYSEAANQRSGFSVLLPKNPGIQISTSNELPPGYLDNIYANFLKGLPEVEDQRHIDPWISASGLTDFSKRYPASVFQESYSVPQSPDHPLQPFLRELTAFLQEMYDKIEDMAIFPRQSIMAHAYPRCAMLFARLYSC